MLDWRRCGETGMMTIRFLKLYGLKHWQSGKNERDGYMPPANYLKVYEYMCLYMNRIHCDKCRQDMNEKVLK